MERPTKTVRELLGGRRGDVFRVAPEATVLAALEKMAEKDIGALIVCEDERLVGIVSERDYARKVELRGRAARDTQVHEIMTPDVARVTPDQTVDQCLALMKRLRIRHLPVVEDDRVVGILSNRDVVDEFIAEEEHLIHDLEIDRLIMTVNPGTY
jgi:CBS domain-containing protein